MTQIVRVNVVSHDVSIRSKPAAQRSLVGTCARAWNIICGDDAILIPQETVTSEDCVKVKSCNLSNGADCEAERALASLRTRARSIEGGEGATLIAQKSVTHLGRVIVVSRDRPIRINVEGAGDKGAFGKWSRACARRVEDSNHSLSGADISVSRIR
ncbi:MAG: hypothetical protein Udaeo_08530 [Candidatus Udaeobacter sp.]|nr:MAG: hypothetical protein Udaeo_08530 [Candidatus Udaeobacter sp.]